MFGLDFEFTTIFQYSYTSLVLLFYLIIFWLFYRWNEIVVDYPNHISPELRTIPGHKLPPYYPNGWIPILESFELKKNQLKSVNIFGRELAVARGEKEQVYVFDAYCPHLGANLSVGGTIYNNDCNQDCVRCPFHGWSFQMSDGACSNIPYEESTNKAKLNVWQSLEVNNVIFVWHHSEKASPNWFPQSVHELEEKKWVYQCKTKHYINCHIQDIAENGPDVAHLNEIHADSVALGGDVSWTRRFKDYASWFGHEWFAEWNQRPVPESHIADMKILTNCKFLGYNIMTMNLEVNQIGPAYVELRYKTRFLGGITGMFIQQIQPIGPLRNCIIHHIYSDNTLLGYIFGKFLMYSEAKLLERDIQIWNRKAYLSRPHFAKSERSLVIYRRWFSQFYSKKIIDW